MPHRSNEYRWLIHQNDATLMYVAKVWVFPAQTLSPPGRRCFFQVVRFLIYCLAESAYVSPAGLS